MAPCSSTFVLTIIIFIFAAINCAALSSSTQNTTAAQNAVGAASISPSMVASQFVDAHNAARRQVGVPPLSWDPKLAVFAKAYAGQRRADCALVHSPGYAYGENIFWGQGRQWSVPDAVEMWVVEREKYHYDTNSCDAGADCTHYTQIVWRTTQKLGCAKIICKTGDTFIVCEYYPPGNYVGARPY